MSSNLAWDHEATEIRERESERVETRETDCGEFFERMKCPSAELRGKRLINLTMEDDIENTDL